MRTNIIALFTLLLFACGKDEFDSYLIPQGTENIVDVNLYPNSPVLMADGKAQLTFKVRATVEIQARTNITYSENGITHVRDSFYMDTVALANDRIPADQIVITASNGETVKGLTYSTTAAAGEVTFTCQIGKATSKPCRVKLVKPEIPQFEPITVPVVFHLLYKANTKAIANGVDAKFVTEVLERVNKVFAGTLAPAPTYLDTRITFVPATTDPSGSSLAETGIHRVDLSSVGLGDASSWDVEGYIVENEVWNPSKYLNIFIYDAGYSDVSVNRPSYILDNGTVIAGIDATPVRDVSEAEYSSPDEVGIVVHIQNILSVKRGTTENRFEFLFGKFYGLYGTDKKDDYKDEDSDYCSDTYVSFYGVVGVSKRTAIPANSEEDPVYYDSYNIMDPYSSCTNISYEQALRIRKVIENCPLRMME